MKKFNEFVTEAYSAAITKGTTPEQRKKISDALNKAGYDINTLDQSDFKPIKTGADKRLKNPDNVVIVIPTPGLSDEHGYKWNTHSDDYVIIINGKPISNNSYYIKYNSIKKIIGDAKLVAIVNMAKKSRELANQRYDAKKGAWQLTLTNKKNDEMKSLMDRLKRNIKEIKDLKERLKKAEAGESSFYGPAELKEKIKREEGYLESTKKQLGRLKKDPYKYFFGDEIKQRLKEFKRAKIQDVSLEAKMMEVMALTVEAKKKLEASVMPGWEARSKDQSASKHADLRKTLARHIANMNSTMNRTVEYSFDYANESEEERRSGFSSTGTRLNDYKIALTKEIDVARKFMSDNF